MSLSPQVEPVTAKLIFNGVMISCINDKSQYEVGMVICPNHEPKIRVYQQEGGAVSEYPAIKWPQDHDLIFKVNNPVAEGVSFHPSTDQNTSFHRVLDLEGFLLHRGPITVNPSPLQGRRLAVTAGKLYTNKLSDCEFDLLTWKDPTDKGTIVGHIGKIAQEVGLNILCRDEAGSGIQLLDLETGTEICSMPAVSGRTYRVTIDNDCEKAPGKNPQIGTDFRYFYEQGFVTSPDGLKFDLGYEQAVGPTGGPLPSPAACENGFMSQTDTLGIKELSSEVAER